MFGVLDGATDKSDFKIVHWDKAVVIVIFPAAHFKVSRLPRTHIHNLELDDAAHRISHGNAIAVVLRIVDATACRLRTV